MKRSRELETIPERDEEDGADTTTVTVTVRSNTFFSEDEIAFMDYNQKYDLFIREIGARIERELTPETVVDMFGKPDLLVVYMSGLVESALHLLEGVPPYYYVFLENPNRVIRKLEGTYASYMYDDVARLIMRRRAEISA